MSLTGVKIISVDPMFIPDDEMRQKACAELEKVVEGFNRHLNFEIGDEITEEIAFVDCGDGLETITCPFCNGDIEANWWLHAMDKAFEGHFTDLTITVPCCNQVTSLNDLKYEAPVGFASYILFARNIEYAPGQIDVARFEEILNCKLKIIWAHY